MRRWTAVATFGSAFVLAAAAVFVVTGGAVLPTPDAYQPLADALGAVESGGRIHASAPLWEGAMALLVRVLGPRVWAVALTGAAIAAAGAVVAGLTWPRLVDRWLHVIGLAAVGLALAPLPWAGDGDVLLCGALLLGVYGLSRRRRVWALVIASTLLAGCGIEGMAAALLLSTWSLRLESGAAPWMFAGAVGVGATVFAVGAQTLPTIRLAASPALLVLLVGAGALLTASRPSRGHTIVQAWILGSLVHIGVGASSDAPWVVAGLATIPPVALTWPLRPRQRRALLGLAAVATIVALEGPVRSLVTLPWRSATLHLTAERLGELAVEVGAGPRAAWPLTPGDDLDVTDTTCTPAVGRWRLVGRDWTVCAVAVERRHALSAALARRGAVVIPEVIGPDGWDTSHPLVQREDHRLAFYVNGSAYRRSSTRGGIWLQVYGTPAQGRQPLFTVVTPDGGRAWEAPAEPTWLRVGEVGWGEVVEVEFTDDGTDEGGGDRNLYVTAALVDPAS